MNFDNFSVSQPQPAKSHLQADRPDFVAHNESTWGGGGGYGMNKVQINKTKC